MRTTKHYLDGVELIDGNATEIIRKLIDTGLAISVIHINGSGHHLEFNGIQLKPINISRIIAELQDVSRHLHTEVYDQHGNKLRPDAL